MSLWVSITIIALLVVMIIGQVWFIIKVAIRASNEQLSLITLHKEHLDIIESQRDLYKHLLDTIILNNYIYNKDGKKIANWCFNCQTSTLILSDEGEVICNTCGRKQNEV